MTDKPKEMKVPVTDKRGSREAAEETPVAVDHDYLDDLKRVQAEFENYRKRMMKEQGGIEARARARVVERLLPVLDNFERAISHGEGGDGVALVFKELKGTLEAEGLTEIPAEGVPFDPTVHEAVESVEDPTVEEPAVQGVYRRGYRLGDQVLRPAMVVVARPSETRNEVPEEEVH